MGATTVVFGEMEARWASEGSYKREDAEDAAMVQTAFKFVKPS